MRTFRLTDAAFGALGAGRPLPETLGELRKAQLSRHLLRRHELLRHGVPAAPAGDLADPMAALHTTATLVALRAGAEPPPARVAAARHLTATTGGLTLRVRLEDTDPVRARFGLTPFRQLTSDEADGWQALLSEAWRILVTRHRAAAETVAAVLSVLVPVEPAGAPGGLSATSADAYGAVALSPPADARALAVGLLHETQHSVLNAVRTLFDLVVPSPARGYSPWRDDPRPPFDILHGAYAYLAVTRFWRAEAGRERLAAFEFARWRAAVVAAAGGLLDGDRLTPAGRRFTGALRDEAAGWLADPVDADVARLAAGANAEHRARWRLRNLDVAPGAVPALVAAWRDGRPPPAVPGPAVRAAAGRTLERSGRLDRVHRTLRGRDPGDDPYLRGDHEAAFHTYAGMLPGDLEVWAGLAVVSPFAALREHPELVRATYESLDGEVDLGALARWMSG